MTRKKTQKEESKNPPNLVISKKEAEQKIKNRIEKGCQIRDMTISSDGDLEKARDIRSKWSSYNIELLTRIFDNDSIAIEYKSSWSVGVMSFHPKPMHQKTKEFRESITKKIIKLESILERLEIIPETNNMSVLKSGGTKKDSIQSRNIFIVHGHDNGAKEAVARFVSKLELYPIILHEKPNAGRTIIEKFEDYSKVCFAIALLTPDEIGASKDAPKAFKRRARQNVILELGYFLGKLGRNRVCALYKGDVEIPSDYKGVLYIPMDDEAWKLKLAKEIKHANIEIDMNKAM